MRAASREKSPAVSAREPARKSARKLDPKRGAKRRAIRQPIIIVKDDAQELIEKEFADQMPFVLKEIVNYFPGSSKITVETFAEPEPGVIPHFGFLISSPMDLDSFWKATERFCDVLRNRKMSIHRRAAFLNWPD